MKGSDDKRDFSDDDLRARFAALRKEEEAQAPEFGVAPRRAYYGRRRSLGQLIAATVCGLTVVAAVFWLRSAFQKPQPEPGRFVASVLEWKAPTDFLLETPGRELLRTVPAIGVWQDYTQGARPGPKRRQPIHPQVRKQTLP